MNNIEKNSVLEEMIKNFNPNENGLRNHGIFGLPFGVQESKMILIPIPWEATVSYREGTAQGPKAILDSSQQIDLYDPINPNGWKDGIAMADIPSDIFYKNKFTREKTIRYLNDFSEGKINEELQKEINTDCLELKNYVEEITERFLKQDKIVGIVGGEHSVPLGYLESLSKKYKDFGVLHIDAHLDLRKSYEGLDYSHASIFYNALKIKNITKIVSVGVRDFCEEEYKLVQEDSKRLILFTDYEIKKSIFNGKTLKDKFIEIIKKLPDNIYLSFDIDALVPYLAPNTGTPVIGGFTIEEMTFLFEELISRGKKIIGFDLCEVGKEEWDGNVGARILYKLCLATLKSQNK